MMITIEHREMLKCLEINGLKCTRVGSYTFFLEQMLMVGMKKVDF